MPKTIKQTKQTNSTFDVEKADRVVRFIERYCKHLHGDLAGSPFLLEPFQKKDIIYPAFGTLNADGKRQKRFIYVELPKGNGKSYLLSALALYMACADGEYNAEVYCVAGDREQARIIFDTCAQMVIADRTLKAAFDVFKHTIVHKKTQSVIKVISAEAYSKHGYRPYAICFDELHVQQNDDLYNTLTRGLMKRWDSMCFMITTAGVKNTFAEGIHDYADMIRRGKIKNDAWLPVIYAAKSTDDPFDEKTWARVNPGYGTIINPDNFRILAEEAKTRASGLNSFLRLHLNIWTGSTQSWIPGHVWDSRYADISEDDLKKADVFLGLDLASTKDLSALAFLFRLKDGRHHVKLMTFCPTDTMNDPANKDGAMYREWMQDGWIIGVEGDTQDEEPIRNAIIAACEKYTVLGVGYDPWTADRFAAELYTRYAVPVMKCAQVLSKLSGPSKWIEKEVGANGSLSHDGNPVLAWNLDNTQIYRDTNDNIRPHKGQSKGKIDGIAATVTAVWAMTELETQNPNFDAGSIVSWF